MNRHNEDHIEEEEFEKTDSESEGECACGNNNKSWAEWADWTEPDHLEEVTYVCWC